jgi:hypothetical protein
VTEEEKTGLQILVGNQQAVIELMAELTYNKARQKDVKAAFAWLQRKLR